MGQKKGRKRKIGGILCLVIGEISICTVIVAIWCYRCEQTAHIAVKEEQINIEAILEKEVWTEAVTAGCRRV